MKKIFHIFLLFLGVTLFSEAATRGDIEVIKASENIRFLSQKIVKDYLFFYDNQNQNRIKKSLATSLDKLNSDFRVIATSTKDGDTKDILEFLAYSREQIEQIFNEKPNKENAALMLDYSETLLEGADSISNTHKYDFSKEERMLMLTKKIEYLLERVMKYYIAVHSGFNSPTNQEQMKEAINGIEESLVEISSYHYPEDLQGVEEEVNYSWSKNRTFLAKTDTLFIPKLMFLSVSYMTDLIDQIALYHSKNQ